MNLSSSQDAGSARSRLYTGWVGEHRCEAPETLDMIWAAARADQARGLHLVVMADYEWGMALQGVMPTLAPDGPRPALRLLVFRQMQRLDQAAVADLLLALDGQRQPTVAGVMDLQASVSRAEFDSAIDDIHQAIRRGETYQVNFTYRLTGQAHGSAVGLYRRLRMRQPVAFGALLALPAMANGADSADPAQPALEHVLSLSPELFVEVHAGEVTARPMKGTAARLADPAADRAQGLALAADAKSRAENLMIVDLLRNDLGRIAQLGTVTVPALFAVEPYATVFQMTSTVRATLQADVDFPALLRASFPCGSITGAPKRRTMQHIQTLESTPRGLYCGALGWMEPATEGRALGDLCLSVAIRTLVLGPPAGGCSPLRMGVGAGIVLDSVAADEWAECRLKARFLTTVDPGFELFETLLCVQGSLPMRRNHLRRLAGGAARLGFAFDPAAAESLLDERLAELDARQSHRLRLALRTDGQMQLSHAPLTPLVLSGPEDGTVGLVIADAALPEPRPLAGFKTTLRQHYDAAVRAAEAQGAFDSLLFSADGRLLEGGRSNVFVRLAGRWITPPLSDGVLPGVMRAAVLADPRWQASERTIWRQELASAEDWLVCNALRGALRASLLPAASAALAPAQS
ncbi:chorismate-binding protein [Ideonella sp.]|uniref:bifunctional chorismate-binding protein/class IV aminotransferase n=1 Tax=Ideonella sp. TaxID=1929293 RepID=UPI003BB5CCB2